MKFIKNLKSLFIIEPGSQGETEQEKGAIPDTPVRKQADAPDTRQVETRNSNQRAEKSSGQDIPYDERFLDTLLGALEANNMEGFDYLEFRQALLSLEAMKFDEATRFKSAFAMATTMKVTPDQLVRSAKVYLDVLDKENKSFTESLRDQEETQVKSREERIAEIEHAITEQQAEIEKLMTQITISKQESDRISSELVEVHEKIKVTKTLFESTFSYLYGRISTDIQKMNQYLK